MAESDCGYGMDKRRKGRWLWSVICENKKVLKKVSVTRTIKSLVSITSRWSASRSTNVANAGGVFQLRKYGSASQADRQGAARKKRLLTGSEIRFLRSISDIQELCSPNSSAMSMRRSPVSKQELRQSNRHLTASLGFRCRARYQIAAMISRPDPHGHRKDFETHPACTQCSREWKINQLPKSRPGRRRDRFGPFIQSAYITVRRLSTNSLFENHFENITFGCSSSERHNMIQVIFKVPNQRAETLDFFSSENS